MPSSMPPWFPVVSSLSSGSVPMDMSDWKSASLNGSGHTFARIRVRKSLILRLTWKVIQPVYWTTVFRWVKLKSSPFPMRATLRHALMICWRKALPTRPMFQQRCYLKAAIIKNRISVTIGGFQAASNPLIRRDFTYRKSHAIPLPSIRISHMTIMPYWS